MPGMLNGDALTLIIPVWNRIQYIKDALQFYQGFPFRVIVADSSQEASRFSIFGDNVEYIYNGPVHYFENIKKSLELVDTEFSIVVADDDFIRPTIADKIIETMKAIGANAGYGANLYFEGEYTQKRTFTRPFTTVEAFFTHENFLPLNHGVARTERALALFEIALREPLLMTIRCHDETYSLGMTFDRPAALIQEDYFLNRQSSLIFTKGQKPDERLLALYPKELRRHVTFVQWLEEFRAAPENGLSAFIAERQGWGIKEAHGFAVSILERMDPVHKDRRPSLPRQSRRWRESVGRVLSREWNALTAGRDAQPRPGGKGTISRILTRERRAVLGDFA